MLVTYVFPPLAAVGVYRILKFCKYLRELGIEPIVYTPSNPNMRTRDDKLIRQVPSDLRVYRSSTLELFRWKESTPDAKSLLSSPQTSKPKTSATRLGLMARVKKPLKQILSIPDQHQFWIWTGLLRGVRVVQNEAIDIIMSSSPPQSTHVLASRIARLTGRPHLVDFRDLWTQNTSYSERNFPAYLNRRDRNFERKVLKRAAGISVNTASFKRQLLENNSFLRDDQIEVVTNGVDPDDFRVLATSVERNDKFTMLYTGSIYGHHRNPEFFLAAVRKWLDANPGLTSKIRLVFIGNCDLEFVHLFEKYKLEKVVVLKGWRPQTEAMTATLSADLLLLFQGFDQSLSAAIPRKLYEYMITNKPILAFAPPGEIPNLIDRYNCGLALSDAQPEPIIGYLNKSFSHWENAGPGAGTKAPTLRSMPELETITQVKKLAELSHRLL